MTTKEYPREQYLRDAISLLSDSTDLLFEVTKRNLTGRDKELFILLSSCCNTSLGIRKLLEGDVYTENEAYMLMRGLLERLVNFHYLRVANESEVEKYFLHAYYRMYHSVNKQEVGVKGNLIIKLDEPTRENLKRDPNVQRALELFGPKPGKEWTDKKFKKRLNFVIEKTTISEGILLLASTITYGDSSEILHGTFYGSIFLTGAFTPGSFKGRHPEPEEVARNISAKLRLPLVLLAGLIMATVEIISHEHGYGDLKAVAENLELKSMEVLQTKASL